MGVWCSRDSTRVANSAKVVLTDGTLQEFSYPVKVSWVVQKNPKCFVCNSDDMDFDNAVSAVSKEDELRPGQLYFALPLSWLNQPLRAEEMAALAMKASSALMKSGGGWKKWDCDDKDKFSGGKFSRRVADGGEGSVCGGGLRRVRRGGGCGNRRRKFTAKLSAIAE